MSLETITDKIKQKMSMAAGLSAKVKFNFGDEGLIYVDTTQSPPDISHEDKEADVTLSCTTQTFEGILNGTQDPNIAFMMGKLKVKGNMGLAMKLNAILED
ncbi:MAG: SCP2 sterol-binding domain-containing protein [Alphaproteobacteria bacterium]|nr:SCP2 sterol-binding domain-containing protein [Alphaproteobacteria bacterium]